MPTPLDPPAAVLPKTNPSTGGKESRISTAVGAPAGISCPTRREGGGPPSALPGYGLAEATPPHPNNIRARQGIPQSKRGGFESTQRADAHPPALASASGAPPAPTQQPTTIEKGRHRVTNVATLEGGGAPTRAAALQKAGSRQGTPDDASALHPYSLLRTGACPPHFYACDPRGGGEGEA